jgi:TPP-dependent pyruvate/acetoin dehydrogenase alpha subunit
MRDKGLIEILQRELDFVPEKPSEEWRKHFIESFEQVGLSLSELTEIYKEMLVARFFENKGYSMFFDGKIPGYFHSGAGQEAIAFGAIKAIRPDDYVVSNYRGHVHLIAKGGDIKKAMAEILGKAAGCCGGIGGSMYTIDTAIGYLYSSGIVSATIPVAVGAGLAIHLENSDKVVLSFFGDGAASEGEFHECLNFASIFKLPVVFIVENNKYSITTNTNRSISVKNVAFRASGYNIPGAVVDGMDFLEVYLATKEAVRRARSQKGPTLIEALTYRFHGHTRWDPAYGVYRSKEILEWYKANDPIERMERFLKTMQLTSAKDIEKYRETARQTVENAVQFALDAPFPEPENAYAHVYADYEVYRG